MFICAASLRRAPARQADRLCARRQRVWRTPTNAL